MYKGEKKQKHWFYFFACYFGESFLPILNEKQEDLETKIPLQTEIPLLAHLYK